MSECPLSLIKHEIIDSNSQHEPKFFRAGNHSSCSEFLINVFVEFVYSENGRRGTLSSSSDSGFDRKDQGDRRYTLEGIDDNVWQLIPDTGSISIFSKVSDENEPMKSFFWKLKYHNPHYSFSIWHAWFKLRI